jgi:hypothetical protein
MNANRIDLMRNPEQLASASEVHRLSTNNTPQASKQKRIHCGYEISGSGRCLQDIGVGRLAIKLSSWSGSMGLVK